MTGMKLPAAWFESLRPARNRIWLIRGLRWMKRAGWAAAGWMLLVLILARMVPVAHPGTWAAAGGAAMVLLGALRAVWARPAWAETVGIVDRTLGLEDRLVTAWQMRRREEPVAALQREDALERLRRQMPLFFRATPPVSVTKRELWGAGAAAFLLAALFLTPNPLTEQALKQERIRSLIAKRAEEVEKWREAAEKEPGVSREAKEAVRKELSRLSERLKEARSLEEAALELAKSDEKLSRLREQAERRSLPARRLAEEWQEGGMTALGQAMQSGGKWDEKRIAEAIRGLKPEERKKLAEQMNRLAGEWSAEGDRQAAGAAESLRTAAGALASNAVGGENAAARALSEAQQAFLGQQADARMLAAGSRALSGGAAILAGGASGAAGPADGTPLGDSSSPSGSGSGTGAGKSSGSGAGSSAGSGVQGGTGSGSGRSSGGGAGAGGSGSGSGAGNMVLVPWSRLPGEGQRGFLGGSSGEGTETEAGTPSATPGMLRPYGEVFSSYEAEAREALERGEIPPELQWLVREYFSTLEP